MENRQPPHASAPPETTAPPMIGVVGGMGPYAGLDLVRKIFDQTIATSDQDHLPVALLSVPAGIEDRTRSLLSRSEAQLARALTRIILQLEQLGARIVGIPCNTAHCPAILDEVRRGLARAQSAIRLIHMIEGVARHLRDCRPDLRVVGVLATTGTALSGLYPAHLEPAGLTVLTPSKPLQAALHAAVYDEGYGIKACASPVSARARADILSAFRHLKNDGAEAVILGCTELPLALAEPRLEGIPLIDPTLLLARELIAAAAPDKLRPLGA